MLVLPRGTGDAYADLVEKLIKTAQDGYLVIGSVGSTPFGEGLTLFDERDLGPRSRAEIEEETLWYHVKMGELGPVKDELTKRGHEWYFLGKPNTFHDENGLTVTKYWLNGSGSPQPFGWYSLDELLAEKFVGDAQKKR